MNTLNFTSNISTQQKLQNIQQNNGSQENFTALDKEQLKQDAVDLSNKAENTVKENWLFKTMRDVFNIENPKKKLISIGLSIATVIGVAVLGNKLSTKAIDLGQKVDGPISKIFDSIKEKIKPATNIAKDKIGNLEVVKNVKSAMEKPCNAIWNVFRGFENGAKGLFSQTILDELGYAKADNTEGLLKSLTKLFNGKEDKAKAIIDSLEGAQKNKIQWTDNFLKAIAETNGCKTTDKKFVEICKKISNGDYGDNLINITMKSREKAKGLGKIGNIVSDWWPANLINNVSKKLTGHEIKSLKGDVGDSILKYGSVRGKLAKTLPAKFLQIIPSLAGDQVSNFVNDKSGMGVFLALNLVKQYDNLQEAPNNKKLQTAANDVANGSLSWLLGMPLTYASIYTMVTLGKNLPWKNASLATKALKAAGSVVAFGYGSNNKLFRVIGGIGRFAAALFIVSPFVNKQIDKVCNKVFGKPYNHSEELKKQQQENQIIPELGISQKEFVEKIQKNPKVVEELQKNPELVKKLQTNPKLLVDLLDGKDINEVETQTTTQGYYNGSTLSSANSSLLRNRSHNFVNQSTANAASKTSVSNTNTETTDATPKVALDTATYIPSSEFVAKKQELSAELQSKLNQIDARSDKLLAKAEKLMH